VQLKPLGQSQDKKGGPLTRRVEEMNRKLKKYAESRLAKAVSLANQNLANQGVDRAMEGFGKAVGKTSQSATSFGGDVANSLQNVGKQVIDTLVRDNHAAASQGDGKEMIELSSLRRKA